MMYNQKLIASVKANGKILREFKDNIYIPFNSEYSILIKNLETKRVVVNVYIDGDNMTPDGLVLMAGQEVDLERSIKNNNLNEGNRFKFIERTGAVENHRGIKLEDGLIRIEYQFEYVYPTLTSTWPAYNDWANRRIIGHDSLLRGVTYSGSGTTVGSSLNVSYNASSSIDNAFIGSAVATSAVNDAGITVPGSISNQKFTTSSWFATDPQKHSIVLKLLGETPDNKVVTEPITVKSKPKCVTCGKQNKALAKFCTECGTGLQIVV